jgi:hypothetical protein
VAQSSAFAVTPTSAKSLRTTPCLMGLKFSQEIRLKQRLEKVFKKEKIGKINPGWLALGIFSYDE